MKCSFKNQDFFFWFHEFSWKEQRGIMSNLNYKNFNRCLMLLANHLQIFGCATSNFLLCDFHEAIAWYRNGFAPCPCSSVHGTHYLIKTSICMQYSCFRLLLEVVATMVFSKEDLAWIANYRANLTWFDKVQSRFSLTIFCWLLHWVRKTIASTVL